MTGLKEIFEEVTSKWAGIANEPFTNHPLAIKFRNEFSEIVTRLISEKYPHYIVKSSVGAGNWANVPWLSILNPEITKSTQDGIYPVYLFRADGTGVYLSLNQGTTTPRNNLGITEAENYAIRVKENVLNQAPSLRIWGQASINLVSSTSLGRSYESPNISARFYDSRDIPSEEVLVKDLNDLLEVYSSLKIETNLTHQPNSMSELKNRNCLNLSKPFLLLAGISGTGKSRFVREQAKRSGSIDKNFKLISVRPDWHEPSDLLGYISRINEEKYIVTDVLKFMVSAWLNACDLSNTDEKCLANKPPAEMSTFWLCLDEMNLAPVEQYFADYLSVIETRDWDGDGYSCDPILKADVINLLGDVAKEKLRSDLGLNAPEYKVLWDYFIAMGIPLPPNLIVAGTVNMDETTHGFSRKVIDRALTLDFGQFFPNDFDQYLEPTIHAKPFTFPTVSKVKKENLEVIKPDVGGVKTIQFCKELNNILKNSSFELAFRALNELLIALVSTDPKDEAELQAVWDDFLMTKVLPRIEGDADKLSIIGRDESILTLLEAFLDKKFSHIKTERIDFFRENDGKPINIPCRSMDKIKWMQERLDKATFTSFWP